MIFTSSILISAELFQVEKTISLKEKQIYSFLTAYLNHVKLRQEIYWMLISSELLNDEQSKFLNFIHVIEIIIMEKI